MMPNVSAPQAIARYRLPAKTPKADARRLALRACTNPSALPSPGRTWLCPRPHPRIWQSQVAAASLHELDSLAGCLQVAAIVRGADTDRLDLAPEAAGLLAISLGLSRIHSDDHAQLEAGMAVYDALYRWCRDAQGEKHNWSSHQPARGKVSA